MDIKEIQELKRELTQNITDLLVEFQSKTSCNVEGIEYSPIEMTTFAGEIEFTPQILLHITLP